MPRCAPDVVWHAQPGGVRLEAPARGLAVELGYPYAAVWDFVARGISEARRTVMIRHIGGFPDDLAAAAFVAHCLEDWQRRGLLLAD
jgi:hypothetical protein